MLRLMGGNPHEQTPLYAGNPEYPAVLTKYVSDNPSGADNQQERPEFEGRLENRPSEASNTRCREPVSRERESSEAIRGAPSSKPRDEDMVHTS